LDRERSCQLIAVEGYLLKIAIIANTRIGGGKFRAKAYKDFLESKDHCVTMLSFDEDIISKVWFFYQRALRHLEKDKGWHRFLEKLADRLESRIKREKYDAVIGVETPFSYVLSRDLGCLKIFSWEAVGADEIYFRQFVNKTFDIDSVRRFRKMELEICKASDYVVFPWKTTENYVRKYIFDGNNFITIKYGCNPKNRLVSYFFPVSIVSMGTLRQYWSNKPLLSYLTRISPYEIDVYGTYRPPSKYNLNYKGFAASRDVLYNYQFGLNTISKDILRRNHHSSRILTYLEYGLPVLSPDWMQFSYEIDGVLPYNEDNFVDILEKYSDPDEWEKISKKAYAQALELDWKEVLKPLERIFEKG
jgi:hypothetical protein